MSSRKLVTIFGATGNQGGSVAQLLLKDAKLKSIYSVRAVTRDASKPPAQALKQAGAEVVEADLDDTTSLQAAVRGAYAVFGVTNFWASMSRDVEVRQGKNIVDAVVADGNVKQLIWSSLPHATTVSNGTLTHIEHFDGKADVEKYAEQRKADANLSVSYVMPGFFMSNLKTSIKPGQDGVLSWTGPMNGTTSNVPLLDVQSDTGKFVAGVLQAGPQAADGKNVHAVSQWATPNEVVASLSEALGKPVNFVSVPLDVYKGFLPAAIADELGENMALIGNFDYYGKGARAEQNESDAFLYKDAQPNTTLAQFVKAEQWML